MGNMKRFAALLVLFAFIAISACSSNSSGDDGPTQVTPSGIGEQSVFTSFDFKKASNPSLEMDIPSVITDRNIALTVPYGTNVKSLVATFTTNAASVKANNVEQASGATANSYSDPLIYTLTSADGTLTQYPVTVYVSPGNAKTMTGFSISGIQGIITEATKTIGITLPYGTDVKSLVASFTTTGKSVSVKSTPQTSNETANDFSRAVTYMVTAADGSSVSYKVYVYVAPYSARAITSFMIEGFPGLIDEQNKAISVVLPMGTDTKSLVSVFAISGSSASIGGVLQQSGVTVNDFTSPVIYTVTAADGNTADYTVKVSLMDMTSKAFTAFSILGMSGKIDETAKTITVTLPTGSDIKSLVASFVSTGAKATANGAEQISGATPNNFTNPVAYTVTALDGSSVVYTVSIKLEDLNAKDITSFSLLGIEGSIVKRGRTPDISYYIYVSLPFGTDVSAPLAATFQTTGMSVKIDGVEQASGATPNDFTKPVVYTVTAKNLTQRTYTVVIDDSTWSMYQGNASHTGYVPVSLNVDEFKLKWSTPADPDPSSNLNPVVATKDYVIFTKTGWDLKYPYVKVLNASTGETAWERVFENCSLVGAPTYYNGAVYFQSFVSFDKPSEAYIAGYQVDDGKRIFENTIVSSWQHYYAPTLFKGNIYTEGGGTNGDIFAFNSQDGDELWKKNLCGFDNWTPAVDDNYVYMYLGENGGDSSGLYLVGRVSGNVCQIIEDKNWIWGGWSMNQAPVIGSSNDIIAINDPESSSFEGRLLKFDLNQNKIEFEIKDHFTGQPSVAKGVIYCINGRALEARNEYDGSLLWTVEPPNYERFDGTILVTNNHVILSARETLTISSPFFVTYAVSLDTHEIVWSYKGAYSPAWVNETLYLITYDCSVVAIEAPVIK
jgi:hypothetical protein